MTNGNEPRVEIDPERLAMAVEQASNHGPTSLGLGGAIWASVPAHVLYTLIDAARTILPRKKEIEGWVLVNRKTGERSDFLYKSKLDAVDGGDFSDGIAVRLTGTATIPAKP